MVGVMLLVPMGVGPLATHLPAAANGSCLVGAGTSGNPYWVTSAADLAKVGSGTDGCTLDAFYLQTANITLAAPAAGASNHTPIGVVGAAFTGTYDGGGFTIDGLVVVMAGDHVGLFGRTDSGVTIRNVHVTRGSITGGEYTGGLMGTAIGGAVSGSSFSGTVTSSVGVVGGLIGYAANSTLSGSSFSGTVGSSVSNVGGLIGFAPNMDVIRSFSEGTVNGQTNVGGLVGQFSSNSSGDVHASFSTADVNGTGSQVGGLIGLFEGPMMGGGGGALTNSFARGDVTITGNAHSVGGLIGGVSDATITRVYATGEVSVSGTGTDVEGLVGRAARTSFTDSFWDTQTSGRATIAAGTGKTTAELTSRATFADVATDGLTTAWPIVAGWAPYVDGTTVWGICAGVNDGYPFLLWQFDTDPCSAPAAASSSSLAMSCDGTRAAGTKVTCTVTGGDAGIDILWRAAYNPVIAEAGVTLDAAGAGTFSFVVPAAAFGQPITVELVDWAAPASLGVSGGPVPTSVPSGEGPVPVWPLGLLALAGVLALRRRAFGPAGG